LLQLNKKDRKLETSPDTGTGVPRYIETGTLDLTDLSLDDLERVGPSSFGHALRRVLSRDDDPADPVVGFAASI
jgi:FXSXX-COOH protein